MEGKNSFILYKDLLPVVRKMKKEDRGDLFLMILEYVNDLNPETDNEIVELVFEGIRQTLKRDLCKWNEIRGKRSLAGKASAKARSVKKSKQVSTSVKCVEQKSTNPTVSVSDSVTVSDTVTDKDINIEFDFLSEDPLLKEKQKQIYNRLVKEGFIWHQELYSLYDFKSRNHIQNTIDMFLRSVFAGESNVQHISNYKSHFLNWLVLPNKGNIRKLTSTERNNKPALEND